MTAVLEVEDLNVYYGKVQAVRGIHLTVQERSIVTVIGANGAGKTTTLAAIMGMLPSRGRIRFLGQSCTPPEVETLVARGLCLVPEQRELFATMSVEDNLRLGAFVLRREGRRASDQTLDQVYLRFPKLKQRRTQLAGTLSGGERAMLVLGRALMAQPKVLMLDEPSLGLAPLIQREIFHMVADLRDTGAAILLVEQNARAALQVSDYAYVLETGEVLLHGPSAELADNPRVAESYLGIKGAAL